LPKGRRARSKARDRGLVVDHGPGLSTVGALIFPIIELDAIHGPANLFLLVGSPHAFLTFWASHVPSHVSNLYRATIREALASGLFIARARVSPVSNSGRTRILSYPRITVSLERDMEETSTEALILDAMINVRNRVTSNGVLKIRDVVDQLN
jgi:hypothetical protein